MDEVDVLLEEWRASRSEDLAHRLTVAGEEASRLFLPIRGATPERRHEQWLDVAYQKRTMDLPRLLDEVAFPPSALFRERVARLSQFPDDPRIALALAKVVESRPGRNSNEPGGKLQIKGWKELLAVIVRTGDTRCIEPLVRSLTSVPRHHLDLPPTQAEESLVAAIERTIEALRAQPQNSPAPLRPNSSRTHGEFLEQIYADPDDDTARLVYADWLDEQGDPRGEFIQLQFLSAAGTATSKQLKREKALLKAHLIEWLGPIESAVSGDVVFEKGFLFSGFASFKTLKQVDELVDHPAWSTLRVLTYAVDGRLLVRCPLIGLRRIDVPLHAGQLDLLATREKPLPRLQQICFKSDRAGMGKSLAWSAVLPALTELVVEPWQDGLRWLVGTPLGDRVERLVLTDNSRLIEPWWGLCQALPKLTELAVGERPAFRLLRDEKGWRLGASNVTNPLHLTAAVASLKGAITRIEVGLGEGEEALQADLQKRLVGCSVTFHMPPSPRGGEGRGEGLPSKIT